ncbi:homoserine/homoserine lactone efflux protein [Desulfovibrio sp. JC010]|uniref:homoserine/homoserine lactone efflux protein n=1 Tax=Desulfovibrio sp. JC010 TaxID=2593641 RepID=UPI0013D7DA61|nr:homoserine/homoserine lactone efflux protein [Desulfovibrio sp. JC010]NDV25382.1 homoserine/homoserine lactone efflux protein [Desulfovibrio sp. JC010]
MPFSIWISFVAVSIIFSLSPGAGAVVSMSTSMRYGARKTLCLIAGLQFALLIHLICVAAGLGALLASSVFFFEALKYAGAGYLIWLGIKKWRERAVIPQESNLIHETSAGSLFKTGMMVNLSNPKSIVFLAAFLPQFIDPAIPALMQYLVLGATTLLVDAFVMIGYMCVAGTARRFFSTPKRILMQNRIFGTLFMGAGLALATARRST